MAKTLIRFKKQRKRKFKVPHRVQDLIPVDMIWKDGIFKTGAFYSKCYRFADINFKVASDEHKKDMLNRYAALLGSLDCEAFAQIGTLPCAIGTWATSPFRRTQKESSPFRHPICG